MPESRPSEPLPKKAKRGGKVIKLATPKKRTKASKAPKRTPEKSSKVEKKVKPTADGKIRFADPFYHVEWSRSQVLFRTGFRGGGQSISLKFGDGAKFATVDDAKTEAARLVRQEMVKQGFDEADAN